MAAFDRFYCISIIYDILLKISLMSLINSHFSMNDMQLYAARKVPI